MRLFLHKLRNWEYWSVNLVYAPTFVYWIWKVLRFRSIRFYVHSNPGIKNGGLYGDNKFEIYNMLPKGSYPKTILINEYSKSNLSLLLQTNQLDFPLIVKPDIGCRGVGVECVNSLIDLETYSKKSTGNFLIQEKINFEEEIGLFYVRIPGSNDGQITGITIKKFLTLKGNGKDTLLSLLKKNPRFALQIDKLKSQVNLDQVLSDKEEICLVPFGNHSRGTLFLDGSKFITPALEKTMNQLLGGISGFYYGRLDIRFSSFEELERGERFSIIELNGAKSEPTHIYDPKHSFWFGQKEIFRHQRLFMKIVLVNILKMKK